MLPLPSSAAPKIAFYGGSFDPPHAGHAAILQALSEELALDQILLVPTGQAPHKARALSAPEDRLAMAQLAFGKLPQVQISRAEIDSPGPHYTIETLERLEAQAAQPIDWYLVLGSDQLAAITTWRRWQELLAKGCIVLAERALPPAQSAQLAANIALCPRLLRLKTPIPRVSSTQIRAWAAANLCRLANAEDNHTLEESSAQLLEMPVLRYMVAHRLYGSNPNTAP